MPSIRGFSLSALLVILFLSHCEDASGQAIVFGNTDSPSSSGCNCVLLRQCPALFTPGRRLTFSQASDIRRRRCGFSGNNIQVCCPGVSGISASTPAPTTPPPPSYPTTLPLRCGQPTFIDRIIGGVEADLGAHPWIVALGYRGPQLGVREPSINFRCGGSLITTSHVVTAAHCVHPDTTAPQRLTQLNIGEWNTETDPDCTVDGFGSRECAPPVQVRTPEVITWHPQYNSNLRHNNDIAVIRLNAPVEYNFYVRPICIPDSFRDNGAGYSSPFATGWGLTENNEFSNILLEVRVPFADLSICNDTFRGLLSENQLCAGGEEGKDTCIGDSGGPLVAGRDDAPPFQLVGLTSFGQGFCGRANNYGVYTVVADFRPWIVETLKL